MLKWAARNGIQMGSADRGMLKWASKFSAFLGAAKLPRQRYYSIGKERNKFGTICFPKTKGI
jgi:hypothetical protein